MQNRSTTRARVGRCSVPSSDTVTPRSSCRDTPPPCTGMPATCRASRSCVRPASAPSARRDVATSSPARTIRSTVASHRRSSLTGFAYPTDTEKVPAVTEAAEGNAQSLSPGYVADIVRHPDVRDRDLYVFDTAADELVEVVDTLGPARRRPGRRDWRFLDPRLPVGLDWSLIPPITRAARTPVGCRACTCPCRRAKLPAPTRLVKERASSPARRPPSRPWGCSRNCPYGGASGRAPLHGRHRDAEIRCSGVTTPPTRRSGRRRRNAPRRSPDRRGRAVSAAWPVPGGSPRGPRRPWPGGRRPERGRR